MGWERGNEGWPWWLEQRTRVIIKMPRAAGVAAGQTAACCLQAPKFEVRAQADDFERFCPARPQARVEVVHYLYGWRIRRAGRGWEGGRDVGRALGAGTGPSLQPAAAVSPSPPPPSCTRADVRTGSRLGSSGAGMSKSIPPAPRAPSRSQIAIRAQADAGVRVEARTHKLTHSGAHARTRARG